MSRQRTQDLPHPLMSPDHEELDERGVKLKFATQSLKEIVEWYRYIVEWYRYIVEWYRYIVESYR